MKYEIPNTGVQVEIDTFTVEFRGETYRFIPNTPDVRRFVAAVCSREAEQKKVDYS